MIKGKPKSFQISCSVLIIPSAQKFIGLLHTGINLKIWPLSQLKPCHLTYSPAFAPKLQFTYTNLNKVNSSQTSLDSQCRNDSVRFQLLFHQSDQ